MKRFFTNRIVIIIMITILLFILMGASSKPTSSVHVVGNPVSFAVTPFQKIFTLSSQKIGDFFYYFRDVDALRSENEQIKKELEEVKERNRKLISFEVENKNLRDALNLKDIYTDYKTEAANVIAKDLGNWFNIFITDKGTKDGIQANFAVRTSKGLVGRVESADIFSSKVLTIVDPGSTVSAKISKSGTYVLIRGDLSLKEKGLCYMDYVDPDVEVSVGDLVETSGLGGIYPKGIIIGKVIQTRKSSNDLSKYAIIEPAVDFKKLEEVVILKTIKVLEPEKEGSKTK